MIRDKCSKRARARVSSAVHMCVKLERPPVPTSSSMCSGGLTKMASHGPSNVRDSDFRKRSAGLFMSAVCSTLLHQLLALTICTTSAYQQLAPRNLGAACPCCACNDAAIARSALMIMLEAARNCMSSCRTAPCCVRCHTKSCLPYLSTAADAARRKGATDVGRFTRLRNFITAVHSV